MQNTTEKITSALNEKQHEDVLALLQSIQNTEEILKEDDSTFEMLTSAATCGGIGGQAVLKLWLAQKNLGDRNVALLLSRACNLSDIETFKLLVNDKRLLLNPIVLFSLIHNGRVEKIGLILASGRRFEEIPCNKAIFNCIKRGNTEIANMFLDHHYSATSFIEAFHAAILYKQPGMIDSIRQKYQVPVEAELYYSHANHILAGEPVDISAAITSMPSIAPLKAREKLFTIAAFAGNLSLVQNLLLTANISQECMQNACKYTQNAEVLRFLYRDNLLQLGVLVEDTASHFQSFLCNVYQSKDTKLFEVIFERKEVAEHPSMLRTIATHMALLGKYDFIKVIVNKLLDKSDKSNINGPIDLFFFCAAIGGQVSVMSLLLRSRQTTEGQGDFVFSIEHGTDIWRKAKNCFQWYEHGQEAMFQRHVWIKDVATLQEKFSIINIFSRELYRQEKILIDNGKNIDLLHHYSHVMKISDVRSALLVCKLPCFMFKANANPGQTMGVENGKICIMPDLAITIFSFLFSTHMNVQDCDVTPYQISQAIFDNPKGMSIESTTQPAIFVERLNWHLNSKTEAKTVQHSKAD